MNLNVQFDPGFIALFFGERLYNQGSQRVDEADVLLRHPLNPEEAFYCYKKQPLVFITHPGGGADMFDTHVRVSEFGPFPDLSRSDFAVMLANLVAISCNQNSHTLISPNINSVLSPIINLAALMSPDKCPQAALQAWDPVDTFYSTMFVSHQTRAAFNVTSALEWLLPPGKTNVDARRELETLTYPQKVTKLVKILWLQSKTVIRRA